MTTKSELQAFMRDNRIEVVEVVKSEDKIGKITRSGWQEGRPNFQGKKTYKQGDYSIEPIPFGGGWQLIFEDGSDFGKKIGTYTELNEAKDAANEEYLRLLGETSGTKFSRYQLAGEKENYKEVLVTMPSKKVSEYSIKERPSPRGVGVMYDVVHNKTNRVVSSHRDAAEAMDNLKQYNKNIVEDKQMNFKSGHFDEPNILVHLRMNTRTDADGNKVLFLEEVQSDWGQKGKKDGFVEKIDKNNIQNVREDENVWVVKFDDGSFLDISKKEAKNADEAINKIPDYDQIIYPGKPGQAFGLDVQKIIYGQYTLMIVHEPAFNDLLMADHGLIIDEAYLYKYTQGWRTIQLDNLKNGDSDSTSQVLMEAFCYILKNKNAHSRLKLVTV